MRTSRAQTLAHNLLEGVAEVATKHGVDARIDGRIAVAEPEENGEERRRNALRTECTHHVHGEEGHPAHDETSNDDS